MARRAACLALAGLLTACSRQERPSADVNQWMAEDVLALGVEGGDPAAEFSRIGNVLKLPDGRIAVADGGSLEVRLFTPDGTHQLTFGRRGRGPGEFTALTRLARAGDTILAGGNRHLVRFTTDGAYLSEQRPDHSGFARLPYFVEYALPLPTGGFMLVLLRGIEGDPDQMPLHRPPRIYLITSADAAVDTLGAFPGLEQLGYRDGSRINWVVALFPADTRAFVGQRHVLIGDMAADSLLLYDLGAKTKQWVTVRLTPTAITAESLQRAQAAACDWTSSPEERARCEVGLARLPRQSTYPLIRDLAVDSSGSIWLAENVLHPDSLMTGWQIFNQDGAITGRVRLPPSLRITQIGDSYILGVSRDSLGVERVHEFRLIRR